MEQCLLILCICLKLTYPCLPFCFVFNVFVLKTIYICNIFKFIFIHKKKKSDGYAYYCCVEYVMEYHTK